MTKTDTESIMVNQLTSRMILCDPRGRKYAKVLRFSPRPLRCIRTDTTGDSATIAHPQSG